ncbi:MAG: hypothetical protein JO126_03445 [Alphaproteobacteria bacterium]|nr:hypothetical protein [Alphaproteobacteria bacterium]MBV8548492.1 hypothetical protein [Alphaproteobacteria bacterium]
MGDGNIKVIDFSSYSQKQNNVFAPLNVSGRSPEEALTSLMRAIDCVATTNNIPFSFVCAMIETEFKCRNGIHTLTGAQIQDVLRFLDSICIRPLRAALM